MSSGGNNMDNKSDNQLHIIQDTIEANRQDYDEKKRSSQKNSQK